MMRCDRWLLAFVVVLLVFGCGEDTIEPDLQPLYLPNTSPENLVKNLQTSYRRREIDQYTKLLAPEFVFVFQPADAGQIPNGTWNRDADSLGTGALFRTPDVSNIRIDLLFGAAEKPQETGFAEDVRQIRIKTTFLEVNESASGITLQITDPQDFFFRPGRTENGEDPGTWFLLEWRDLPSVSSPGHPLNLRERSLSLSPETETSTWGKLKSKY